MGGPPVMGGAHPRTLPSTAERDSRPAKRIYWTATASAEMHAMHDEVAATAPSAEECALRANEASKAPTINAASIPTAARPPRIVRNLDISTSNQRRSKAAGS